MRAPGDPARSGPRAAHHPPPRAARWLVRRSKLSPKKRAIVAGGQRGRHLAAAGPGQKQRGRDHAPAPAATIAAAQTERSSRWRRRWIQIAGRDDDGQPRHQQRDARAAGDAVEIEQARNQAAGQRGGDGEEIDEIARQRIDRRPIDDRRILRRCGSNQPELSTTSSTMPDIATSRPPSSAAQCSALPLRSAIAGHAASPEYRRGSARSDRAAPARRSPAARTADRTTSACAGRARWRAQIRRAAATGRSRPDVVSSKKPGFDRPCEPRVAPVLADQLPGMQQQQRPERPRQHQRAELEPGRTERRDRHRQQHREHRLLSADDGARQQIERPERRDRRKAAPADRRRTRDCRRRETRYRRARTPAAGRDRFRPGIPGHRPAPLRDRRAGCDTAAAAPTATAPPEPAPRSRPPAAAGRGSVR